MVANSIRVLKSYGLSYCAARLYSKIRKPRIENFQSYAERVKGKKGLEVGGPSAVFARDGLMPLYDLVGGLDNCNNAPNTLWAPSLPAAFQFSANHAPGRQYFSEGSDLSTFASDAYDFILSCHMLEHTANPIRALFAWKRVLKQEGTLILLLPDSRWTFDHRRTATPFQHLKEDYEQGTSEADLTHLPEILDLHDFQRDPQAGDAEKFKLRCQQNAQHRGMHHHVFSTSVVSEILKFTGFRVDSIAACNNQHIVALATKR